VVSSCICFPTASSRTYLSRIHGFFFFQAEDGIRDFHVTGVQTCALPIFEAVEQPVVAARPSQPIDDGLFDSLDLNRDGFLSEDRSEERRVGKEGRTQRPADTGTKKSRRSSATRWTAAAAQQAAWL